MNLSRREFLRLAGLVSTGAALGAACTPIYGRVGGAYRHEVEVPALDRPTFQALNRLTFGPTPGNMRRVQEIGLSHWIEEQLSPQTIQDSESDLLIRSFEALDMKANALEPKGREEVLEQLRSATLLRQLYSRRQLYERIVAFWTDHFNISVDKGDCWFLKVVDDGRVIRSHALGHFEELLSASAHSPAMLVYLDNQANLATHPNENYARELMELHTLGVKGGYSQQDVMELARCLTGWTVKEHFWKGEFEFKPDIHDPREKMVLGRRIDANGKGEAEIVLRRLAQHPATAEHLAVKLVERFLVDEPERQAPEMVAQVAATFKSSQGDIQAVLRKLLLDGLASRVGQLPPKFKRPTGYVLSALRALGARSDGGPSLHRWLAAMGQPLFAWPTPDGPPADSQSWVTNLLPRWQFALDLARDELPGTKLPMERLLAEAEIMDAPQFLSWLCHRLLGGPPSAGLQEAAAQVLKSANGDLGAYQSVLVAGVVASPQFQWR